MRSSSWYGLSLRSRHPRLVVREGRDRLKRGIHQRVVDLVKLKREEQQLGARVGELLLHVAVELGADRIDVSAESRPMRADAAEQIVQRLILLQRLAEVAGRPLLGSFPSACPSSVSNAADSVGRAAGLPQFRRVDAGVEVGEVPFRQLLGRFCLSQQPRWRAAAAGHE